MRRVLAVATITVAVFAIATLAGAFVGDLVDDDAAAPASSPEIDGAPQPGDVPLLLPLDGEPPSDATESAGLFGPAGAATATAAAAAATGTDSDTASPNDPFVALDDSDVLAAPIEPDPGPAAGSAPEIPVLDVPRGFEDPCAADPEADGCPEGEPGTIGGEARAPGPLSIYVERAGWSCTEAGDTPVLWIATNNIAALDVTYPETDEDGPPRTVHVAPTDEQRDTWHATFNAGGQIGPFTVKHCVDLTGAPARGSYLVTVFGTDEFGSSDSARAVLHSVGARPPVVLEGTGHSTLYVSAPTRSADRGEGVVLAVVESDGSGAECEAAENANVLFPEGDAGPPRLVDALAEALESYDESYVQRAVWQVPLEEGRDFFACLWWYRSEFGELAVAEREQHPFSTPDLRRYRISVVSVTSRGHHEIGVREVHVATDPCAQDAPGIVPLEAPVPVPDEPGQARWETDAPPVVCDTLGIEHPDITDVTLSYSPHGEGNDHYEGVFAIRTPSAKCECDDDTQTRVYLAPIPEYEDVIELCGDGFWECEPERGEIQPGWVGLQVERYDGARGGLSEWVFATPDAFGGADEGPPPYARLDHPTVTPLRSSVDSLVVEFETDRPVRSRAVTENLDGVGCPGGASAANDTLATDHVLTISGLCPGDDYPISIILTDEAGTVTMHWLMGDARPGEGVGPSASGLGTEDVDYGRRLRLIGATNAYVGSWTATVEIVTLDVPDHFADVRTADFTCTPWGIQRRGGEDNDVTEGDVGRCSPHDGVLPDEFDGVYELLDPSEPDGLAVRFSRVFDLPAIAAAGGGTVEFTVPDDAGIDESDGRLRLHVTVEFTDAAVALPS